MSMSAFLLLERLNDITSDTGDVPVLLEIAGESYGLAQIDTFTDTEGNTSIILNDYPTHTGEAPESTST